MHPRPIFLALLLTLPAAAGPYLKKVADGFERPLWAGMPADDDQHLWVMEQAGTVWIIDRATGQRLAEPFLRLNDQVSRKGNEEGLLGLAFAPDFQQSGRCYVNFTDKQKHTRIVRLTAAGPGRLVADPASAEVLLTFEQPWENHNGGWICFGPDGFLYIGNGDGGSGNDPRNAAQRLDTLLGKILRIDVSPAKGYAIPKDNPLANQPGAKPEIWAYGVRNPWRCSFDRQTGDFWMGDVGQNRWEEINFQPAGHGTGANYGWRLREADHPTPEPQTGGDKPAGAVDPIYSYAHGPGKTDGMSVTGGYVCRGPVKSLQGRYIFGDYQNGRWWSFVQQKGKATDFRDHTEEIKPEAGRVNLIASFAEDNQGNLFLVDHTGPVYQIVER